NHRRYRLRDVERLLAIQGSSRQPGNTPRRAVVPPAMRPGPVEREPAPDWSPEYFSWQERVRNARARTEVLKAEEEAKSLADARAAQAARAARDAEQARKREEQERTERDYNRKLEGFRDYGRSLSLQAGLPADWRARVAAELEGYVTRD